MLRAGNKNCDRLAARPRAVASVLSIDCQTKVKAKDHRRCNESVKMPKRFYQYIYNIGRFAYLIRFYFHFTVLAHAMSETDWQRLDESRAFRNGH